MADNSVTDEHFYKWIGNSDVNEEIDVYKDYINYENYCPWCWEDYSHFSYKIEWDKLYLKHIDFDHITFWNNYEDIEFKFIKNWILNEDEVKRYFKFHQKYEYNRWDAHRKFEYKDYLKKTLDWFEFKPHWRFRYTNDAKKRIVKQIKNKNFRTN